MHCTGRTDLPFAFQFLLFTFLESSSMCIYIYLYTRYMYIVRTYVKRIILYRNGQKIQRRIINEAKRVCVWQGTKKNDNQTSSSSNVICAHYSLARSNHYFQLYPTPSNQPTTQKEKKNPPHTRPQNNFYTERAVLFCWKKIYPVLFLCVEYNIPHTGIKCYIKFM